MTVLISPGPRAERVPADRGPFDFGHITRTISASFDDALPYLESSDDRSQYSFRLCNRTWRESVVSAERLRALGMSYRLCSLRRLLDAGIFLGDIHAVARPYRLAVMTDGHIRLTRDR